jgi:hypothetical protein
MTAASSRVSLVATIALLLSGCGATRMELVGASATTLVLGTVILVGPATSSDDPGPQNEGAATVFGTTLLVAGIACAVLAIARGPSR